MSPARQLDLANRQKPAARARASAGRKSNCKSNCIALSIVVAGGEPPDAFCIFTAGQVETTKGTFTFDDAAAKSVMADYKAHGIDLMIDYDHGALSSMPVDPALSGRAAGWFNIELRNGELWAVNVRWTPAAADALRAKEWRFMSPAFQADEGRVCSLMNVAITNLPATRQLEPLMAASQKDTIMASDTGLSPKLVSAALEAVASKDAKGGLGVLQQILAALLGGSDPDASTEDAPPPAGDGGADEATEPMAAGDKPAPADKKDDKPEEVAASVSRLMRLTGAKSFVDAIGVVDVFRASHLDLETERQKLAKERETLETAERRKLCVERVTLGGKKPSEVWADDAATTPKPYLLSMPIADLRAMCSDEIKANGKSGALRPPVSQAKPGAFMGTVDKHGLDAREQQICKEAGTDPAVYAELKARREAAKTAKG